MDVPPHKRQINTVFRSMPFSPLNVFENIAFGLRIAKTPQARDPRARHGDAGDREPEGL